MEDHTVSSAEADELMVDEERHDHMQSRESQPKSCRNMHPPQSAPSFASYYGVYQALMPSPASDTYLVPVPLHQPSQYVGPGFVLVQSPMFSSDGRQYMPMVTHAPVQAIPMNETYRTGYYHVDPARSPPSRENVGESAMRRSVHFSSNSHFGQPLATSTPGSSFSQGPNEQRRSAPTRRAWVPVHGAPVPSTFPPVTTLPFQHVPSSNLTYSVSPPVNQQSFAPTFSAGAASPPSSPRILSPSAPSRFMATYPPPAPPTEYVICSASRNSATRHPPATQTHALSSDSGFESVDSGLDESCRSPTNSSTSAGNISDMQGRYYISAGQISFDPPLNLSSNEVRYAVPLQSSQNTTAYNETNLQMSSIQELSDGRPQLLDGSNTPDTTPAEQERIESKPAEVPMLYDASRPPQIPSEWIPPPALSSTDNYTELWRSTPVESSYPSPDKSNLDVSSIQESSDRFSQTLHTEVTVTEQNWIEAKPMKLNQREDTVGPEKTVCAWVPPSSPDHIVTPARSNQAGVQTPREWAMGGVSTAVQTPCGWEGGPAVTQPATPLAYCAGSCPTNRDLSRRKRRRKKICCDHCKAEMKEKAQEEDGVQEQDSRISEVESLDAGSTYSTSHERTVMPSSQDPEENENSQEPQETTPEI